MTDLRGKVVFVTGSARRVGREIALTFAEHGADVVIHYASPSSEADAHSAADAARTHGGQALVIGGDQSVSADVDAMFQQIKAHYGRLDVLVNSAAIFKRTPLLDITEAEWDLVMDVNLKGPFLLTQGAARLMQINGGGVIINISDNSGLNAWASRPHHSISKAGVIMLTQVSALALAPYHIRVNCIVPGPVLVPADAADSVLDDIASALPVGHIGEPRNIADACLFFVQNPFATGSILRVDGGEGLAHRET
ncbi:MAG: SDR family NAD(P)-dependent oxidoreductase [Phototrophicaceae bacterium]